MDTPTPQQRAALEAWLKAHPYGEQDSNGIDVSLLRENLKLTPAERLAKLQQSLNVLQGVKRVSRPA